MPAEPAYAVRDLRSYLAGAWRLSRRMSDFRTGKTARYEGEGRFTPDRTGLAYSETGRITLDGAVFETFQAYLYRFPELGRSEVLFQDARPFHILDLTSGQWSAEHLCAPDRYSGTFRAESQSAWRSEWRIEGPRKDQIIETVYRRGPD